MLRHLLTIAECSEVLFGENTDPARKRAKRLLNKLEIPIIKNGRQTLVRRDHLNRAFFDQHGLRSSSETSSQ